MDVKYALGSLYFGGRIAMETNDEIVVELPCNLFIRIKK